MSENKIRILAVEDDELDRRIIRKALKDSGIEHELFFAEDHQSGEEATTGKEYDCIFLDYHLPGGTGLELLKTIRASGNTSPIVIVTSQRDVKIAVEAMKLGADDYIPKNLLSADGIAQSLRYMFYMKEQAQRQRELESKLQETQDQLNTVVANAPIILFSLDNQSEYQLFEGRGLESLGIKKEAIIGKKIDATENLPLTIDDYMIAMNGEEHTVIVEWNQKYFEIFYSPIRDNDKVITGVLGVASDITSHILAEDELKQAKLIAEDTAKIKEKFLANTSHEIRTPMNGIMGLTRILMKTSLDPEQMKYLDSIRTCSENLLVIINDILDFTKIEAGKMNFEKIPFQVGKLANQTIELFQAKADEKSIQLVLEVDKKIPHSLHGDPTRLSQILNNLVSNAIKFTEVGEVRLSVNLTSSDNKSATITFEIKDSGIGIPEKSLPFIFDSFTQASSDTTRKFGGTGLGLTIVKSMIELQYGEIDVKSKPGFGTTFIFSLPFALGEQNETEEDNNLGENLSTSHLRILIAEDNIVNQMIVKKVFSDWNTYVDMADNGLIALEMLRNGNYDMILMDMQMPEMDGYTAVRKIRAEFDEPKRSIPIMAMTAHAVSTEKQKCFDAGMDDYISKPFDPDDLKRKIILLTNSHNKIQKISQSSENRNINHQAIVNSNNDTISAQEKSISKPVAISEKRIAAALSGPKINLSYLKKIAEGNDTFVIEMIEMFLNKTPQALEQMNDCFKKQNWEELRKIAHKIKPSFAYIGLKEIQATLAIIETWDDREDALETVTAMMEQVEKGTRQAYDQLRNELLGMK